MWWLYALLAALFAVLAKVVFLGGRGKLTGQTGTGAGLFLAGKLTANTIMAAG